MFVPHARVRLTGLGAPRRKRKRRNLASRRKLKLREHLRMPCLLPTCASCLIGLLILLGGTAMSFVGYHPMFAEKKEVVNDTVTTTEGSVALKHALYRHPGIKTLSYVGPMFMGCGLFIMIIAGVLYCEIIDKYVNIEQEKTLKLPKEELYDIIIQELRKNYFRGIEVPLPDRGHQSRRKSSIKRTLFKALSISTPALLVTPEINRRWQKRTNALSKKYQDEAPEKIKLKLLPSEESWVKTSSLPDIAPKNGLVRQKSASSEHVVTRTYLETKRISRSCGNVTDIFHENEINSHLSSSCFDNPAYIPDMDKSRAIALVREQCKKLVKGGSKCSVHWDDECGSDVSLLERHPLATKEELRLFDSTDDDRPLCLGSTSSLREVRTHPLQSSSFEIEDCDGDSEIEAGDSDIEAGDSTCVAKRVSVIVHQASVHQSDEDNDASNMQREGDMSHPPEASGIPECGKSEVKVVVPGSTAQSATKVKGRFRPPLTHSRRVLSPDEPDVNDCFGEVDTVLKHVDMSRVTYL